MSGVSYNPLFSPKSGVLGPYFWEWAHFVEHVGTAISPQSAMESIKVLATKISQGYLP